MASTITHAYFILDVYDRLQIESKELLLDQKELLKIAAQGMDVLFFYNICNFHFKKGKRIRQFGHFFHEHQTYEFFSTLIYYIKYNGYYYDPEVMAYLYGMLSHYILDRTIHPFVIYKSGQFDSTNPETYRYNQKHAQLENYFDNYFIQLREGILPWKFRCDRFCFQITSFSDSFTEVMNFTYKEVFGINHMSKFYLKAIKQMHFFYRVFRYDRTGMKKKFYQLVDFFTPDSYLHTEVLSYHTKVRDGEHYLNLEHNTWYNPTSKKIKNKKSLLELYTQALNQTVSIIEILNEYLYHDKKINLKALIQNDSYLTGRDCDLKQELKFFEF